MALVLCGSSTGNAVDLAGFLVDRLRRRSVPVQYFEFGLCPLETLVHSRHVFVVCSTTGQGELPANTRPLWTQLLRRSLPADLLAGTSLFTFGLGSSAYPKFNFAARKIHARMRQLGAEEAVPRGEGDDIGPNAPEAVFDGWLSAALSVFDHDLQITDVIPDSELLPPLKPLVAGNEAVQQQQQQQQPTVPPTVPPTALTRDVLLQDCVVLSNARVTAPAHFQDVRLLRLMPSESSRSESPPLVWLPGDVLVLYPQNSVNAVDAVIDAQGWDGEQPVWASNASFEGGWCRNPPISLRDLLLHHVDLNSIPGRQFFATAQNFCSNERHRERMAEFASDLDDLFDYTSRPRRSVAEVICEFDSLRIPTAYILDLIPPLRPRQYSIANACSGVGRPIELAVAVVKYRTALRRVRRGVCSHYVETLDEGAHLRVSLKNNRLDLLDRVAGRPLLLVATGTGIAVARALLQALAQQQQTQHVQQHRRVVFYGCRGPEEDLLFGDELREHAELVPAFSRHGGGYVQQQIAQFRGELDVYSSFVLVCGSSGAMPRAVRESLVERLNSEGHDGEQVLSQKERSGMYVQETW